MGLTFQGGKTDIKKELPPSYRVLCSWSLGQNDFSEEVASGLSSEEFTRQKLVNAHRVQFTQRGRGQRVPAGGAACAKALC